MKVAVIPARGGSKRIPRKNVKSFCGKPMIVWSIEAAIASGSFDRVIVSTDDEEIASVAEVAGAEVPFVRPPELCDDWSGTIPVIRHSIQWLKENGCSVSYACCIYATAPFIQIADIHAGLGVLRRTGANFCFPVTEYRFPIQRAIRLDADNHVEMFDPQSFGIRSQDLEQAFHDAGQFYWGSAHAWLTSSSIFSDDATAIRVPRFRVQDIDVPEDWMEAELLFKLIGGSQR